MIYGDNYNNTEFMRIMMVMLTTIMIIRIIITTINMMMMMIPELCWKGFEGQELY